MAAIGQYIYNYLSSAMSGINLNGSNHAATPYKPSVADVLSVKEFFHTERDQKLPVELINTIIDYAEYWPHTTTIAGPNVARGNTTKENVFILRSFPLGFPPSNDHYQISKDGLEKYPSTAPTPWPDSNNTPGNATEELLREWAEQSHISVEHPCRKIVFYITSHDQGHGGGAGHRGTYHGAYSWFDVGLETVSGIREKHFLEAWNSAPRPQFEISPPPTNDGSLRLPIFCCLQTINPPTAPRPLGNTTTPDTPNHIFDHPLPPSPQRLQSNVVAERQSKEHIITWSYNDDISPESPEGDELENSGRGKNTADGEFIRSLKIGDVVTVWAKARFPMWANVVEEVKMEVYWAV